MGLIIFVSIVAIIAILGFLIAYGLQRDQLFPPYQEPLDKCPMGFQNQEPAKEDSNWPFPTTRRP
jgi:energy-converting hydrogenase Eha subunit F